MNNLLTVPVLLPMLGAALTLALGRRPRLQRLVSILVLTGHLATSLALMVITHTQGIQVLWVAAWKETASISLVADRLSALMLVVASVVILGVLIFSIGQDEEETRQETPVSIFHPTFMLLATGVSNAFLAGDLFNIFVGFEILLFASYVLLTMGGTGNRIRAGSTYVVVNLLSSSLFLIGIAYVYSATGTVNLAQLAQRIPELPMDVQIGMQLMLLVVFSIKAAIFPMSGWLPDSYPTAPGPVTAAFAGLLTKVGVYAIIRTQTLLFSHHALGDLLLVFGAITMLIGIMGAIAQSELKRMLSFTLVSHIGYMLWGIGLGTRDGLSSAIYYTAHHIVIQATLFLVAGLVQRVGGSTSLDRLNGLVAISPGLAVLFFVPAMNLAGIPPFSGFIGKIGLIYSSAELATPTAWWMIAVGVITSLLTLYAMAKAWNRAFWGDPAELKRPHAHDEEPDTRMPGVQVGATIGLIVVGLLMTIFAGQIYDYTSCAADGIRALWYVDAVLAGGRS